MIVAGTALVITAGTALVALGLVTARRPVSAIPDRAGYLARWSVLHGGYDPTTGSRLLLGWLSMVCWLARPLARRGIHPDLLTVSSIWLALTALLPAQAGGRWLLLACLVLVASGLLDSLDGCVAVLQDRTTAWGYVLDSVVDRVNDAIFLAAVVIAGAPLGLAVGCGFLCFLLEYLRARAGNATTGEISLITVGERPNRVIFLAAALLVGGLFVQHQALAGLVGLSALTGLTAVGLLQLAMAVRRQLLSQVDA